MIATLIGEWKQAGSSDRLAFVLVLIVSTISVLFGLLNYPVIGHDAYVHLNWLDQFSRLRAQGIGYPRWLSDSFGGYGSPTFYFYPPLVYWYASFLYSFGIHSAELLYNVVQLSFGLLSVLAAGVLLRRYSPSVLRTVTGAMLYAFVAYHFGNVYVRDALTEHAALAFFPLLFIQGKDKLRTIAISAIGWSGLLLTNLPISYLAVISTAVVIIVRRSFPSILNQLSGFAIAILVGAIYLLPAFSFRGLIHQRHLFDLPMNASLFGYALLDLFRGHLDWLRILSVSTVIAALIAIFATWRLRSSSGLQPWIWLLIIGVFFQLPFISKQFWQFIPGMPFVQFGWRWNGILLLALAIIYVRERHSLVHCTIIGLALVSLLSELTLSRNLFAQPRLPINAYRMDAPEYATKWAANDPNEVLGITLRWMNEPTVVPLGITMPGDSINLVSHTAIDKDYHVHLARQTPVRFHQFYWPYWRINRAREEIVTTPDPNGFATAVLPAGDYLITLKLYESPSEDNGAVASKVGIGILILLVGTAAYRSITTRREAT